MSIVTLKYFIIFNAHKDLLFGMTNRKKTLNLATESFF